jgi:hypothetical protein
MTLRGLSEDHADQARPECVPGCQDKLGLRGKRMERKQIHGTDCRFAGIAA